MTQHDETGTAADQPVPPAGQPGQWSDQQRSDEPAFDRSASPSPYLDAGGAMPQAYPAPPQPGQPKYGAPPAFGPGGRQFGQVRQPFGGQPGYQQPASGRPGDARRAFGLEARSDPAIASPWERLAATVLDWIIVYAVATAAFISPLLRIWRQLQAVRSHYPDLYAPGAQNAADAVFRDPSNERALLFWLAAIFGFALVYYWVQHAAWGATIGKRALGTRVVNADRSAIGVRTAGIRAVVFLVGPAAFWLLPSPIEVFGGILWLADTGLALLDSRAQCLHDKLAGTIVIRQRWLDQQARSARPW